MRFNWLLGTCTSLSARKWCKSLFFLAFPNHLLIRVETDGARLRTNAAAARQRTMTPARNTPTTIGPMRTVPRGITLPAGLHLSAVPMHTPYCVRHPVS